MSGGRGPASPWENGYVESFNGIRRQSPDSPGRRHGILSLGVDFKWVQLRTWHHSCGQDSAAYLRTHDILGSLCWPIC